MSLSCNSTTIKSLNVNGKTCTNLVLNGTPVWAKEYTLTTDYADMGGLVRTVSTDLARPANTTVTSGTCYHGETLAYSYVISNSANVFSIYYPMNGVGSTTISGDTSIPFKFVKIGAPTFGTTMTYTHYDDYYYQYIVDAGIDESFANAGWYDGYSGDITLYFQLRLYNGSNSTWQEPTPTQLFSLDSDCEEWETVSGHYYAYASPQEMYDTRTSNFNVSLMHHTDALTLWSATVWRLGDSYICCESVDYLYGQRCPASSVPSVSASSVPFMSIEDIITDATNITSRYPDSSSEQS